MWVVIVLILDHCLSIDLIYVLETGILYKKAKYRLGSILETASRLRCICIHTDCHMYENRLLDRSV